MNRERVEALAQNIGEVCVRWYMNATSIQWIRHGWRSKCTESMGGACYW